jgi:hypothetical protein
MELKHGQQNRNRATEMDYLRHSAKISRMDKVRNETTGTKMGMKTDILQEIEEQ